MTPELDEMNARVQEWLGWWNDLHCPPWTAETAMRALKQLTDHESVQDGEMIPCYHEPELWACGKHWKCRMDSWLDEVADPDPVTAVLRACDKLREKEK